MDVDPLLNINSGHFICTKNNIVNTWNNMHYLQEDNIMHGFYDLPTTIVILVLQQRVINFQQQKQFS
jgi:hypothetical protein